MTSPLPSYRLRAVHLTAIWAFGVSQPVFSLVNGNPELLVLRGTTRTEVIFLATVLTVLPPLAAISYVWVAGRVSAWVGDALYLAVLGVFLVPIALQIAKLIDLRSRPSTLIVLGSCIAGVASYARWRAVRLFVGYSIVLPIVGFVWFVQGLPTLSDEAVAASVDVQARYPVVVVVLDELPVSSLMTRGGAIDPDRYPNFSRLALDATWYRNAATVHDDTAGAVPAILTGRIASHGELPFLADHPENLFTLLGGGYSLRVHEASTRLCPKSLCSQNPSSFIARVDDLVADVGVSYLTRILPSSIGRESENLDSVNERFSSYTIEEFNVMLAELSRDQSEGALYFSHLFLPHAPWRFLPSGSQYEFIGIDGWFPNEVWGDDSWLVQQGFQRHLLQVGYTDAILGRLLRRLQQVGLYERALLVVVADHGVSFRPGGPRRPVTRENLADIANVPMFVKYPRQERGVVDSRAARTIDILPTIADVLGISLPWRVEGKSLLGPPSDRGEVIIHQASGSSVRAPLFEMMRGRDATIRRKAALFGEGDDSLYWIGANRQLLGASVPVPWVESTTVRVRIEDVDELADVRRASPFVPARISGVVAEGRIESGTELAIAVNGRVRALTRCFDRGGLQLFRALVPETALKEGFNRVDVFAVKLEGSQRRLVWLGASPSPGSSS